MKPEQIADVLRLHGMWLRSEAGGQRADLHYADLRGAYLQGVDLHGAELRGAYLQDADLRGAYLQGAYLQGAHLQGAHLQDADLQDADLQNAYGCLRLPVGDPRGYDAVAVWHDDHWMIAAGCYWLSISEARSHWGKEYEGDRHISDRYLYALDWLETSAEATEAKRRAMEAGR